MDSNEFETETQFMNTNLQRQLTAEFLINPRARHAKVLDGIESLTIKTSSTILYSLKEAQFITSIDISCDESLDGIVSISTRSHNLGQATKAQSTSWSSKDKIYRVNVSSYAQEIEISIQKKISIFNSHTVIKKIEAWILPSEDIQDALDISTKYASIKSRLRDYFESESMKLSSLKESSAAAAAEALTKQENAKSKISELDAERIEKEQIITQLKTKIEELFSLRGVTSTEIMGLEASRDSINSLVESKEGRVKELDTQTTQLTSQKIQLLDEVKALENNKNLFATEFASYVEQGDDYISTYINIIIGAAVMAIIFIGILVAGALDLMSMSFNDYAAALSTIIARLPTASIYFLILTICYKLIKIMLEKIYIIQKDRLEVSAFSILAKDVTESSAEGLDIADDDKYRERIHQRIKFIKERLGAKSGTG